jgi:hypothetical protein
MPAGGSRLALPYGVSMTRHCNENARPAEMFRAAGTPLGIDVDQFPTEPTD